MRDGCSDHGGQGGPAWPQRCNGHSAHGKSRRLQRSLRSRRSLRSLALTAARGGPLQTLKVELIFRVQWSATSRRPPDGGLRLTFPNVRRREAVCPPLPCSTLRHAASFKRDRPNSRAPSSGRPPSGQGPLPAGSPCCRSTRRLG